MRAVSCCRDEILISYTANDADQRKRKLVSLDLCGRFRYQAKVVSKVGRCCGTIVALALKQHCAYPHQAPLSASKLHSCTWYLGLPL